MKIIPHSFKKSVLLLSAMVALAFGACTPPSVSGTDLFTEEAFKLEVIDTVSLRTSTILLDSIDTYRPDRLLLGFHEEELLGKALAAPFFEVGIDTWNYGRPEKSFEFWEYDANSASWTRKLDLDEDDDYDLVRQGAVAFTLNGMGYITTGNNGANVSTVWEYLPSQDSWVERSSFEGTSRQDAVGFTVNGRCYITTGRSSSIRLDDLWEFQPTEEYDEDD